MPDFVYDIPPYRLAVYCVIIALASVIAGVLLIKPVLRLLIGTGPDFNQTVYLTTSGFTLFYGLLLGLLTVAAYQNSERVKEGIMAEATTLGSLYADMNSYPEPIKSDMKAMIRDYVLFTIHKDWPAHRTRTIMDGGFNRAGAMRQRLASFEPQKRGQEILHAEVIDGFKRFSEARQQRLIGTRTEIPRVLWSAVLVGAAVNVILLALFRMPPWRQLLLGSITMSFLAIILAVIITLDRPFQGELGLAPDPLQLLWDRAMVWDEPLK